jgi:hypothetical protein
MPKQLKTVRKKPGRPRVPKDQFKGKIVPVRFAPDELKRILAAADANNQNVSKWIRSTLLAATEE